MKLKRYCIKIIIQKLFVHVNNLFPVTHHPSHTNNGIDITA